MGKILIIIVLLLPAVGFSQQFPDVFAGTWCDSIHGIYEHWEKTGDKQLKGFSYEIKNGEKVISEYIDLAMTGNKLTYTVTVTNQNEEKPVSFTLSLADSSYTFVNPQHDFPQYIVYTIISPDQIKAKVGNKNRSFTLNYFRIE